MIEKIVVPVLGESITEATVSKWLKNEGDNVEADEPIVELETDKVNLEVPSPLSGVLTKINSKDGSTVEVGALLGSVSSNGMGSKKSEEIKKDEIVSKESNESSIEEDNIVKFMAVTNRKKLVFPHPPPCVHFANNVSFLKTIFTSPNFALNASFFLFFKTVPCLAIFKFGTKSSNFFSIKKCNFVKKDDAETTRSVNVTNKAIRAFPRKSILVIFLFSELIALTLD